MSTMARETRGKNLSFAFFAGPALWALQLLVGYALANLAGINESTRIWYYILSAVAVLIILAAGFVALISWRSVSPIHRHDLASFDEPTGNHEFIAISGFFLSILFFWLALLTGVFSIVFSAQRMITMPFP